MRLFCNFSVDRWPSRWQEIAFSGVVAVQLEISRQMRLPGKFRVEKPADVVNRSGSHFSPGVHTP